MQKIRLVQLENENRKVIKTLNTQPILGSGAALPDASPTGAGQLDVSVQPTVGHPAQGQPLASSRGSTWSQRKTLVSSQLRDSNKHFYELPARTKHVYLHMYLQIR